MKYEDDLLLTKCRLHTLLTALSSLVLLETSSQSGKPKLYMSSGLSEAMAAAVDRFTE